MGKLQINGDLLLSGSISFKTSNCITPAFSVIADTNAYGQNLLIGAGGNTVVGGGESARELFSNLGILNEENLYLAGDNVFIYTNCNDVTQKKLVMSLNADGTISLPNSKKIDTDGTFSGRAAGIYRINHFTTEEQVDSFQAPNTLQYCTIGAEYTPIGNDGILICAGWSSGKYGAQIWIDDGGGSGGMKIRSFGANNGTSWNEWQTVLTSGNYNDYAPTKTGVGASGTWGINVDGYSARLAYVSDSLTTADLLNGFNEARRLKVGIWENNLVPGCGNGVIINGGWTSTTYGFQLAIDDDPTYFMALRQKGTGGWNEWKRIPMADGTGASGSWGISVTGKSGYTGDGDINLIPGHSNEINFGGSFTSNSSIFFGYRQKDSRPVPTHYYFGLNGQGATVVAANFQGNATSATTATTAETATYVSDYGRPSNKIKIGLNGAGVTTTDYFAVYTSDGGYNAIKDMSVATVKSFLGIDDKLSKSGDTLNGTIVIGKNDEYGMYPNTNNYCQLGRDNYRFWKMFATYGYFNHVVTTNYGGDRPTTTSLPIGSLYFQISE